jgi:hypothetical protein
MTPSVHDDKSTGVGLMSRAALWVWILGVVEFVVCGVMMLACIAIANSSIEQLRTRFSSPDELAMLEQVHPMMSAAGVVLFVLGVLPGMVLVFLGFGVRQGRKSSIFTCLAIAGVQSLLLAFALVVSLIGGLIQGEPVAFLSNLGGPLVVQSMCIRSLWFARLGGQPEWDIESDPWPHEISVEQTR